MRIGLHDDDGGGDGDDDDDGHQGEGVFCCATKHDKV